MGPIQAKRQAAKINALGTHQRAAAFQADWAEKGWAVRSTHALKGTSVESDQVDDTEIWVQNLTRDYLKNGPPVGRYRGRPVI